MNTASIDKLMLEKLANYQQLVVNQLAGHDLVGEFLTDNKLGDARLLCQMRTIIFLCKTADWLDLSNIAIAEKLYVQAEAAYLKDDCWLQQLNHSEEATLYSYAFIILAQSYLLKMTRNQLYAIALAETFDSVMNKFQGEAVFKPLAALDCFEQNSAMHLYEALTFALYQTHAIYMKKDINDLGQAIKQRFLQSSNGLLAEKVDYLGDVVSYEAGHWFEWVSLLVRVEKWGGDVVIDPFFLYQTALSQTHFTQGGLVLNEMNHNLVPQNTHQIRIWPNLEYLRAKTFMTQDLPVQELTVFTQSFFDDNGWPIEYLGAGSGSVKSTTGYHIAESFVDMLALSKGRAC